MSEESNKTADGTGKKYERVWTDAQREKYKQKQKARKEKRKLAKANGKSEASSETQTSQPTFQTPMKEDGNQRQNFQNAQKEQEKSHKKEQVKSSQRKKTESVDPNSVNKHSETQKKKKKQRKKKKGIKLPEKPVFKLTVRKLPPNLSEQSFFNVIYEAFPNFKDAILANYYSKGYLPQTQFESPVLTRCYLYCIDEQSMMMVGKGIKTLTFTNDVANHVENSESGKTDEVFDEEMEVYTPVIEKSLYQKTPDFAGIRPFSNNGGILENVHYKLFVQLFNEEGRSEMPSNIFTFAIEAAAKRKRELKKQRKKKAKAEKAEKAKLEGKEVKKKPKKAKKKKQAEDKASASSTKSKLSASSKPIKFSLKKEQTSPK